MDKDALDRYIANLGELGIIEDLQHIPNRNDYETQADWMRALEAYRDGVLTPTEDQHKEES